MSESKKTLQIVKPITITEDMIVSCNVPETDAPAYNPVTVYEVGVQVIEGHAIYKSAAAGNVGNTPSASPTVWTRVGPTNRHKCLDNSNSTQTVQSSTVSYRIRPSQVVTALALLNVAGDSVRVRMIDPMAGTVIDETKSLAGVLKTTSWRAWFSRRRRVVRQVLMLDLPSYYGADILIDITASGDVKLGVLLLGFAEPWGIGVQYGARMGITDYSKKETDAYGDTQFVEAAYAKRASFDLVVPNTDIDALFDELADLRATPMLIIGTRLYACTVIYGWVGEFEILIPYPTYSDCSLDVKGLT